MHSYCSNNVVTVLNIAKSSKTQATTNFKNLKFTDISSASQLAGQPASQPASQPAGQPASQPAGQLASQPASQPAGQPASQPASQPAVRPGSTSATALEFLHNKGHRVGFMKLLFRRMFIYCAMVLSFILY